MRRGSLAYTPDEVVTVEFSDGGITVSPEDAAGLAVEETALSVSGAGVYALSGNCADGSVKVEAQTEDVVLLLDGLTPTSADTAPPHRLRRIHRGDHRGGGWDGKYPDRQ